MTEVFASKESLRTFLRKSYSRQEWLDLLPKLFNEVEIGKVPTKIDTSWSEDFEECHWLGRVLLSDSSDRAKTVWIVELRLKDSNRLRAKVALRKALSRLLAAGNVESVLAFFSTEDSSKDYRITFAYADWVFEDGKLVRKETPSRRFSFVVGAKESCTTASQRIYGLFEQRSRSKFADLEAAFSVEKLNKDFFDGYIAHYKKLLNIFAEHNCKSLFNLNIPSSEKELIDEDQYKDLRDFVKRLMGRIVFLYFVQKKGWLGAETSKTKTYKNGQSNFIRALFESFNSKNGYEAFCYLFFELLNSDRSAQGDLCERTGTKVPYLNSGLFEAESLAKNKRTQAIEQHRRVFIPRLDVESLLDFLDQFNFTVDENSPTESDVGIDPEMLGHIFENLLEDNRNKGAFYTPKVIVEFMTKKSLLEYLVNNINPNDTELQQLNAFVMGLPSVRPRPSSKLSPVVIKLLKNVKVCDPAVGSGAYPMGILHEILWMLIDLGDERKPHEIKREIISHSLRGVDIDESAIEIARLRFWLSLIVDSSIPEPLPNLDFTLIQGSSIVSVGISEELDQVVLSKSIRDERVRAAQTQLDFSVSSDADESVSDIPLLLENFYNSHGKEKLALLEEIQAKEKFFLNQIRSEASLIIQRERNRTRSLSKEQSKRIQIIEEGINRLETESGNRGYFLWHWYFGDILSSGGFDIVIGNPPYVKEFTNRAAFDGVRESPYYQGKMDLWYLFACLALDHLKLDKGVLCFIATNNWVTNSGASVLRETVCSRGQIVDLIDFGNYKVFGSADIQTMILLLANSGKKESYSFDLRRCVSENPTISELNSILQGTPHSGVELLRPVFKRNDFKKKTFTFSNDESTEVLDRIAARANFLLDPRKEIAQGIVTPQDSLNKKTAEAIGGGAEVGEGVFILSNDELKSLGLSKVEKELIKPFFTTKELLRYVGVLQNEYWIVYTDSSFKSPDSMDRFPKIKAHLDRFHSIITSDNHPYGLHRARDERFFVGRKIVSVRKCDRPTFTLVDEPCYVSQTFNVIKSDRIDLGYLCALLNSTVCAFWLRKKGKMQGSNYQVDKEPLVGIPLYYASEEVQKAISFVVGVLVGCDRLGLKLESDKLDQLLDLLIFSLYFPTENSQLESSVVFKVQELTAKFGVDPQCFTLDNLTLLVESIFSNTDITSNSKKLSSTELFQLMVSSLK
jgi:hypothetical protein